jgi:branched-chain amino acid transport system permease protein
MNELSLPSIYFLGINVVLFGLDLLAFFALYLAISLSLNLEFGFAGIPNFGKVLFIAGGASVGGAFAGRFGAWLFSVSTKGDFIRYNAEIIPQVNSVLSASIPSSVGLLLVSVIVAAAIGALFGFLFSYPAIRLKEDYLAMTLLAMAQFFQIFLNNYPPLIGGSLGLALPDPYVWAGDLRYLVATGVLVVFAALIYIYCERIAHSPLARTLRAVRDNESASEALGKDDVAIRRKTLMVASSISAVAGLLYSFYTVDVLPATFNRVVWTFWPWVIVIMGGAANNLGVGIGVLVFWLMVKVIDSGKFVFSRYIPFDVTWLEYLLIGGILVSILMLRPEGILKEKSTPTLSKSTLRKILAKYAQRPEESKPSSPV